MTIENQVCNLDLAKKLKELGVKQDSLFYWLYDFRTSESMLHREITEHSAKPFGHYSAFTVAELGEILPKFITVYEESRNPKIAVGYYSLFYSPEHNGDHHFHDVLYKYNPEAIEWKADELPLAPKFSLGISDKTEANARAKMLIYVLENRLLTPNGGGWKSTDALKST
jgi:hypothetical protein